MASLMLSKAGSEPTLPGLTALVVIVPKASVPYVAVTGGAPTSLALVTVSPADGPAGPTSAMMCQLSLTNVTPTAGASRSSSRSSSGRRGCRFALRELPDPNRDRFFSQRRQGEETMLQTPSGYGPNEMHEAVRGWRRH